MKPLHSFGVEQGVSARGLRAGPPRAALSRNAESFIVQLMNCPYHSLLALLIASTVATAQVPANKRALLPAAPAPIALQAKNTAVLVVDMENDFGADGGMFDRAGVDISMIKKVVAPTAAVLAAARRAGIPVVYLKMGYREDLADLGREGSPNRVRHVQYMHVGEPVTAPTGAKSRILVRGHWGTEILPALRPQPGELVLYKTRFSGFYRTELDAALKRLGIKNLVVTGCTTSVCVESTVRDAMFRDYCPVVLADCTAEPIGAAFSRSNHEASLLTIQSLFGWVSTSEEFVKAFAPPPSAAAAK